VARTLGALGAERAWVVHGAGGLDEISTLGHTKVSELIHGTVNTFYVHPSDVGLPSSDRAALAGGAAAENAAMVERLLDGERGPRRDIVLINAAAALLVSGKASSLHDGVQRAAGSLDSGSARSVLSRLREVCG
jgi:anthranilate phosphoribosyltransferase